jgi:hypothetical protein
MALVGLQSLITIKTATGTLQFSGLHDLTIKKSIHSLEESAMLKLPAIVSVKYKNAAQPQIVRTATLLAEGDPITIQLAYADPANPAPLRPIPAGTDTQIAIEQYHLEFDGYVKGKSITAPLEVECEGHVRDLRNMTYVVCYKDANASDLLDNLIGPHTAPLKYILDEDFKLSPISLRGPNGIDIVNHLIKISNRALSAFFINPTTLYVGLLYQAVPTIQSKKIEFRLGYNCPHQNSLKMYIPSEPVNIYINGMLASGDPIFTQAKVKSARRRTKYMLNNINDKDALKRFAVEIANRENYNGYKGGFTGFLYPYVGPAYAIQFKDPKYPELDGDYLVESVETTFGQNGARRKIELSLNLTVQNTLKVPLKSVKTGQVNVVELNKYVLKAMTTHVPVYKPDDPTTKKHKR